MATAFTSLAPPHVQDDSMEISSPGNRDIDEDIIDFTFDDTESGGVQVNEEDEQMQEGDRPSTANDELMEDDGDNIKDNVDVPEEVMGDDTAADEDEDLIDYGEEEFPEQVVDEAVTDVPVENVQPVDALPQEPAASEIAVQATITNVQEQVTPTNDVDEAAASTTAPLEEAVDEEIVRDPDIEQAVQSEGAEQPSRFLTFESEAGQPSVDAEHAETAEAIFTAGLEPTDASLQTSHDITGSVDAQEQPAESTDELKQLPGPINTELPATNVEAPGTPTDTGLHPMTVRYGEWEMPLFKSRHQPDGLLKDDNLASLSLSELMQNCRQRLALKTGENISGDQELILGFDGLACSLVENSRPTFDTSLNDVVEVYMQLHQNDGVDEIPTFQLTLSTQLKFSSSLTALRTAAASGQGMSAFGYLASDEQPEEHEEEYYEDHYEEHNAREEFQEPAEQPQIDSSDHADKGGQYTREHQRDQQCEDSGVTAEDQHSYEAPNGQYQDENGEATDAYETYHPQHQASEGDTTQDQTVPEPPAGGKAPADESEGQAEAPAYSDASSTTVRGDALNDSTLGEYDDEIDWDDDSELTDLSEPVTEGQDDFETSLTDPTTTEADAVDAASAASNSVIAKFQAQSNLESEDFFDDDFDKADTEAAGEESEQYDVQEQEDHTDITYDEQHDNDGDELGEGEDDENYVTAHTDFFATGGQEQGANPEESHQHEPSDATDGDGIEPAAEDDAFAHQVTQESAATVSGERTHLDDEEDSIDFDDDTEEQHAARKASQADLKAATAGSPSRGKRSFDEHAEDDDYIDFGSPESKKARAD